MKRRAFGKLVVMAGTSMMVKSTFPDTLKKVSSDITLPNPQFHDHSVEICLNSRSSTHGGYHNTLSLQVLANVLWATSRAPVIGTSREIYAALPDAVYLYDPEKHQLILHIAGNKKSETDASFEIGITTEPAGLAEDAGVALHWAQLASVAFHNDYANQTACCPKDSGYEYANANWNPSSTIHLVNCYGSYTSAKTLSKNDVAISSDNSLPSPTVDGSMILEEAMNKPLFGSDYKDEDLTLDQISQLAWSAYGCTPHTIQNKAGLTVASWNAQYYLTGHIYIVKTDSVLGYHIRDTSGAISSKDHRIEILSETDCKSKLRSAIDRIPQNSPVYFIFCAEKTERPQLLEAGYCGASALLQATAMQLQGHYCAAFTNSERTAIQNAIGIQSNELPLLIFSAGKPSDTSVNHIRTQPPITLTAKPNPFTDHVEISFLSDNCSQVKAAIYDISGKLVRTLNMSVSGSHKKVVLWDGKNHYGMMVSKGTYICKLLHTKSPKTVLLHKS